jgi:hypothetical protein
MTPGTGYRKLGLASHPGSALGQREEERDNNRDGEVGRSTRSRMNGSDRLDCKDCHDSGAHRSLKRETGQEPSTAGRVKTG